MDTSKLSDSLTSQSSSRRRPRAQTRSKRARAFKGFIDGELADPPDTPYNEGVKAFWENYQNASDWTKNQEIAYWRARVVALEFEKSQLQQQIMHLTMSDKLPGPLKYHQSYTPRKGRNSRRLDIFVNPMMKKKKYHISVFKSTKPTDVPLCKDEDSEPELKFEVTEEMKDFLETHMRHKIEQEEKHLDDEKKRKEATHAAGEENAKLISQPLNFAARTEELKVLYGEASPMIHGMETATQLTFRRHCEKTGARLWPNIPLRL